MRAHAGAQDLGRPQRRGAAQGKHLREAERRRAAQDRADVAGVLDAGRARRWRDRPRCAAGAGNATTKAIGAGVSSVPSSAISASATIDDRRAVVGELASGPPCHADSATSACRPCAAASRTRRRRDARLRAAPSRPCDSRRARFAACAGGPAAGCRGTLMPRDLHGGQARAPHQNNRSSTARTGAKLRRWCAAGAVLAQRREVLRRRVALVAVEAVLRMLVVQGRQQAVAVDLGDDRRRRDRPHLGIAADDGAHRPSSAPAAGCRRPERCSAARAGPRRRGASPATPRAGC